MAYIEIPDSDLLPGKPVTPSLFRRLRDNIDAGLDLMAVNMEVLTGAGNWSPPAGVRTLKVTLIGGGGAGGGSQVNAVSAGGAGGGGAMVVAIIDVPSPYDGSEIYAYAVGAGGAGGVDANGANGAATTFGIYTADFGNGGTRRNSAGAGGGGTAAGGVLNINGQHGERYYMMYTTWMIPTRGGGSPLSYMTDRGEALPGGSDNGEDGEFPGGGGGGSCTNGAGGAAQFGGDGAAGTIIIEY